MVMSGFDLEIFSEESSVLVNSQKEKYCQWLFSPTLKNSQQHIWGGIAISAALMSALVCAWMGGEGAQKVFNQPNNESLYLTFAIGSPVLILALGGYGAYMAAQQYFAIDPKQDLADEIFLPPSSPLVMRLKMVTKILLGLLSGAINAKNALEYVPYPLNYIVFIFALCVPGFMNIAEILKLNTMVMNLPKRMLNFIRHHTYTSANIRARTSIVELKENLADAKRCYEQMNSEQKATVDSQLRSGSEREKLKLLHNPNIALLNVSMQDDFDSPANYFENYGHATASAAGMIVGVFSQFFSYKLGSSIGLSLLFYLNFLMQKICGDCCNTLDTPSAQNVVGPMIGGLIAYLGMGISAMATGFVFKQLYASFIQIYRRGLTKSFSCVGLSASVLILALAVLSSAPNAENMIATLGNAGGFAQFLMVCSVIAPLCIGYWAGNNLMDLAKQRGDCYLEYHQKHYESLDRLPEQNLTELYSELKNDFFNYTNEYRTLIN